MPALLAAFVLTQTLTGTFFQGDGMGTGNIFELRPKSSVTYKFEGCFGSDELKGKYEVADDVVTINIPRWEERTALPTEYNIVRWTSTTFLIADDEMPFFLYKLGTGWRGESKTWGLTDFLRSDANRSIKAPSEPFKGEPVLPKRWLDARMRSRRFTVLHCFQPQYQPINGGLTQGLSDGVVLRKSSGDLVFVDEVEQDMSLVKPLLGQFVRPGDKIEPNVPTFPWRSLIKEIRKKEKLRNIRPR